jgi:hypothetical protein
VLVTSAPRAVILDFGLGTVLDPEGAADPLRDTVTDGFIGTLAYMAPEQAHGAQLTEAADWYSAGVMLYEALSGRLPFEGPPMRVLAEKSESAPTSLRERGIAVPEVLDALVTRLLQPVPEARPDAAGVLVALDAARPTRKRVAPARGSRSVGVPFVGRDQELKQLRAAFEALREGRAVTVHVSGPSGIGKSELVRRFLAGLESEAGLWVLRGRCHPQEAVPYNAFDALVDGLTRALLASPGPTSNALLPRHATALVRLFPVLGRLPMFSECEERPGEHDAFELRRRGFAAFREMLGRLADRQPVVLWIDDLQWADVDSEALLRDLRRSPGAPPLLTLLSYRDDSESPASAVIADGEDAALEHPVIRIALGPLDESETRALLGELYVAQPDRERQMAGIVSESSGSPFLITELARHASSTRALGIEVPSPAIRLGDAIRERVRHLSAAAQRLLEVVSIAGQPLERSLALELAGLGESGRPVVMTLSNASLLRTTTIHGRVGVEVYHDRIREAVVAGLPIAATRARHAELADAVLARSDPDPEAVFRHLLGADRRAEAAEWAIRAAERANSALAFVRAAELYRQALSLAAWDQDRANALETQLADALVNAGRGAAAAPIYAGVATRNTGLGRLELRRRAVEQHLVTGHIDEGIAQLRSLLSELELRYPASAGRAWLGLVHRLCQFALRGTSFVPSDEGAVDPTSLLRIDVCDSAAKGLLQVDPIRGVYFSATALLLSLRAGEIRRIGRDLCLGGSLFVAAGGRWVRGDGASSSVHDASPNRRATHISGVCRRSSRGSPRCLAADGRRCCANPIRACGYSARSVRGSAGSAIKGVWCHCGRSRSSETFPNSCGAQSRSAARPKRPATSTRRSSRASTRRSGGLPAATRRARGRRRARRSRCGPIAATISSTSTRSASRSAATSMRAMWPRRWRASSPHGRLSNARDSSVTRGSRGRPSSPRPRHARRGRSRYRGWRRASRRGALRATACAGGESGYGWTCRPRAGRYRGGSGQTAARARGPGSRARVLRGRGPEARCCLCQPAVGGAHRWCGGR